MVLVDGPMQAIDPRGDYKTDASAYAKDLARFYEFKGGPNAYSTLPARKTQYINELPERSVTPDITRGLGSRKNDTNSLGRAGKFLRSDFSNEYVPQQYPNQVGYVHSQLPNDRFEVPFAHSGNKKLQANSFNESLKMSPIDPRNSGGFHSSTPASKTHEIKSAAANLENRLLSPKKSTMSNEELYAVIHKGKKKMNIRNEEIDRGSPVLSVNSLTPANSEGSLNKMVKSPETGYLGDKSRTRMSWSPKNGEAIDDESRSRLSWACNDRKGTQQTSTMDFKKLLLQVNSKPTPSVSSKKVSAVERLKQSKEQIQSSPVKPPQQELNILELSRSPRSIGSRKSINGSPGGSPRNVPEKARSVPKLLSPRSQWRFANPRSDVLSSTILEDCREDESPNSSAERKCRKEGGCITSGNTKAGAEDLQVHKKEQVKRYASVSERLQAQRARFFGSGPNDKYNNFSSRIESGNANDKPSLPTLETAF